MGWVKRVEQAEWVIYPGLLESEQRRMPVNGESTKEKKQELTFSSESRRDAWPTSMFRMVDIRVQRT